MQLKNQSVDDIKMDGKKEHLGPLWKLLLRRDIDVEDPTLFFLSQVHLGWTQRVALVDHVAVQAEADPCRRITTT